MSKWDKLLKRICTLSKDIRFDELRKVLESCGYEMNAPRSGSAIIRLEKKDVSQLRYQSMSQLRKLMLRW